MAQSEDSPAALKLKKMWLKTPVTEEFAAQAVLDPALSKLLGLFSPHTTLILICSCYFFITVALEEEYNSSNNSLDSKGEHLSVKQRHQMKHRELFLSRQIETLPATHIRGKCSVTLLNEEESLLSYLNKDVSSKVEFQ